MFKKQLKPTVETPLTTKDRKKLRQELQTQFDKESLEKLFIYSENLSSQAFEKSKIIVYKDESDPLFVDSTSNKDFFPTVYSLSLFPDLVKFVFRLNPDAEKSIKTGQIGWGAVSNINELPEFNGDEVCGITAADGRIVAVGAIACSRKALQEEPGKKEGPAAFILHTTEDFLFEQGSKKLKAVVFRKPTAEELKKKEEEERAKDEKEAKKKGKKTEEGENEDILAFYNQLNKNKNTTGVKTGNLKKATFKTQTKDANKGGNRKEDDEEQKDKTKGKKKKDEPKIDKQEEMLSKNAKPKNKEKNPAGENQSQETEEHPENQKQSTKESDEQIMEALLNCLVLSLTEDDLPLEPAAIWANHIDPCRSTSQKLDIKASSYKKLGKLFAHLDKIGLITYKEAAKKSATATVTHLNLQHKLLKDWAPTISAPRGKGQEDEQDSGEEAKTKGKHAPRISLANDVINMCKPDSVLKKYLSLPQEAEFISQDDLERRMKDFLKKAGLLHKDQVIISEGLKEDFDFELEQSEDENEESKEADSDKLKEEEEAKVQKTKEEDHADDKKKKKGAKAAQQIIKLANFFEAITKHTTCLYKIVELKTKKETIKQGKFEGVFIYAEKAHAKLVTRVVGLGIYGVNLEALLADWQAKFSATGSIHEVVVNKQHLKEISLSGIFIEEVKEYLTGVLKIPDNLVVVVDKIGSKKKEKGFQK